LESPALLHILYGADELLAAPAIPRAWRSRTVSWRWSGVFVALLSTSRDGNVTTVDMTYRVTLVQSEEGFAVWCDDLPGCNSQGQTREEALANIKSAISEYLAAQPEIEERFNVKIEREEVTV
jgi:predicted RNase H-like HicB family nuclease